MGAAAALAQSRMRRAIAAESELLRGRYMRIRRGMCAVWAAAIVGK